MMKRILSFGLMLALLLCLGLTPGCAQHPVSPSPEEEDRTVTLAGGAAGGAEEEQNQPLSDSSASSGEDTSDQQEQQEQQQDSADLSILSQPRVQQYGTRCV